MGTPPGPPVQPGPVSQPEKRSPLPWVLGGLGLAAIVAVVLVLVFVVFGNGATGTDVAEAERVVENFYKSWENRDADMLLSTFEPSFRAEFEDALGEYYDLFFEYFFEVVTDDLEITIRKMDTRIDGDRAVVAVVDGTMTYTDEDGVKVKEEASESDIENAQLRKVDGKWYLDSDFLRETGFDPEEIRSYMDLMSSLGDGDTIEDTIKIDIELPIDTKEEAFSALLEVPELSRWYWESFYSAYQVTEEDSRYVFYLFNQPYAGDATPYGWYAVDKETGEVTQLTDR
jgi:hypothetical protein